jgi:photosystem II stability/assembly factor-like uncharacterized protein
LYPGHPSESILYKENSFMNNQSSISRMVCLVTGFFLLGLVTLPTPTFAAPPTQESGSPLANQTWVRLGGPLGGLGYDIRVNPVDPNTMFVTDADAGVHKSVDGGKTWFASNSGIDLRLGESNDLIPVFCLTIDPNNPNIVWVGLQDFGMVYRSADEGKNWERRGNGITDGNGFTVRGIAVEPGNSNVVYAAGEISSWNWAGHEIQGRSFDMVKGVVYKSIDGGLHWHVIWRGDNLARYVIIDPKNVHTLYVSTGIFDREAANSNYDSGVAGGVGILKSVDGGETWNTINKGLGNLYVGSLFMSPENSQVLIAGAGNGIYGDGGGVYITYDGGQEWKWVVGRFITSVEFAMGNPKIAYGVGRADQIFRSEDGGNSWRQLVQEDIFWGPPNIVPGFPIDIQVDPRDANRIFVNNYGGGNFLSEDGGKTWRVASTGYSGAMLLDVEVSQDNPAIVYSNGRSGPFISVDGGEVWESINPISVQEISEGATVSIDPSDTRHILFSSAHWGWTYNTYDRGVHSELVMNYWDQLQGLSVDYAWQQQQGVQALAFAPSNPKVVYAGMAVSFCAAYAEPGFCQSPAYISLLKSTDGGSTWKEIKGTPFDRESITRIIVHPRDQNLMWVATAGSGVYVSRDGGGSWATSQNELKDSRVMSLAIDAANPDVLYAGVDRGGLYKSADGGKSWKRSANGMDPNESIFAIVADPVRSGVLYAGSNRSGVYISEDSGKSWKRNNAGLSNRAVKSLSISSNGETLYAATWGGGVFRLSTHDQAYFDSLAPTAIPPTVASLSKVTETPANVATPVPSSTTGTSTGPLCGSATIVPFGFVLFLQWRRKARR